MLRAPGRTVLTTNERQLPVGSAAVEGTEFDFRSPRAIGGTVLDHCFTDLERDEDGIVRVDLRRRDDATGTTLWMDGGFGYAMLFTGDTLSDLARRAVAVEPMTCPPNAFRTGTGLLTLEPGETFRGRWGITLLDLPHLGSAPNLLHYDQAVHRGKHRKCLRIVLMAITVPRVSRRDSVRAADSTTRRTQIGGLKISVSTDTAARRRNDCDAVR